MDKFAKLTGRQYHLFDYAGAPDAERVIIMMGSGAETAEETADYLNAQGEKVGVLTVHLYRPFSVEHFAQGPARHRQDDRRARPHQGTRRRRRAALPWMSSPPSAKAWQRESPPSKPCPIIIGGRYGLSSKEFTPAMVKAVFDELNKAKPKNHFTIGINDDVTHTSLAYDPAFSIEDPETVRCVFFGLGADGTVGANKNSIKIIGEETDNYAQGYFVYDSKKSGSVTISHLRFGPQADPRALPDRQGDANFVACHQFSFLERFDMLQVRQARRRFPAQQHLRPGRSLGPPAARSADRHHRQETALLRHRRLRSGRTRPAWAAASTPSCRPASSPSRGVLPRDEAIAQIKKSIKKTYGKRGEAVVQQNFEAVDETLANLHEVKVPAKVTSTFTRRPAVPADAPDFVKNVLGPMHRLRRRQPARQRHAGRRHLPHRHHPVGKTQHRPGNPGLGTRPVHPVRQMRLRLPARRHPPEGLRPGCCWQAPRRPSNRMDAKFKEFPGMKYTIQVAPEDCTGCGLCVEACPAKDKTQVGRKAINMAAQPPLREPEARQLGLLPDPARSRPHRVSARPRSRTRSCCSRCSSSPAPAPAAAKPPTSSCSPSSSATAPSSPTPPAAPPSTAATCPPPPGRINNEGRGPAWSNSLFEDNAEFGLGMRLTLDKQIEFAARTAAAAWRPSSATTWSNDLLNADQTTEAGIRAQRERVAVLKQTPGRHQRSRAPDLLLPWPMSWSRRASGSSAATAGPTTSVTAAWITSWPPAATSTSWCWIPKSIPTPAASPPSPPRAPQWPSSLPTARACPRKTWA